MENKFTKNLSNLVNSKQKLYLVFLFVGSIILSFFELIGIGSIGIFVAILSDSNSLIEKIPFELIKIHLNKYEFEELIIFTGVILCIIFFTKNVLIIVYHILELQLRKSINVKISEKIYTNYLYKDIDFHNKKNPAELINIVNSVTNSATQYIFALLSFSKEIVLIIFIISGLLVLSFELSVFLLSSISLISLILFIIIKNTIKNLGKEGIIVEKNILKSLNEGLGGIKINKILENYNFFIQEFSNLKERKLNIVLIVQSLTLLPKLFLEVFAVISITLVTVFLMKSNMNLVEIIPIISIISISLVRMIPAFSNLNTGIQHIRYMGPFYERVSSELRNKVKEDCENVIKKNNKTKFDKINSIQLNKISFSFDDKIILDNANIEFFKGQFIGIVGETGAGKTTFIDIILGLLKLKSGKILINNQSEFDNFYSLKGLFGYVPQEIYLSDGSILENITFGEQTKDINYENLYKSIKFAQLEKFVNSQNEKLNSKVGDRGVRISGGQKQRIGIARALYRNPKVLIMDESTNSLDTDTEENFLKMIKSISEEMIVILVTHKKSSLLFCDKIFELKHGKFISK